MSDSKKNVPKVLDGPAKDKAWEYAKWKKELESAFVAKNLLRYLNDASKSKVEEQIPEFSFVLEEEIEQVDENEEDKFASRLVYESPKKGSAAMVTPSSGAETKTALTTVRSSPGAESFKMSKQKRVIYDQAMYYTELSRHETRVQHAHKAYLEEVGNINACLDILKERTSPSFQTTLRTYFNTRDIFCIVQKIDMMCGATKRMDGLGILDDRWAAVKLKKRQSVQELAQIIDDLADDFGAFYQHKSDDQKIRAFEKAIIIGDPDYEVKYCTLFMQIKDEGCGWETAKDKIHQANVAALARGELRANANGNNNTTAAAHSDSAGTKSLAKNAAKREKDRIEKGRDTKDVKEAKDQKADKKPHEETPKEAFRKAWYAEFVKTADCHNCGQKGHLKADCPNAKENKDGKANNHTVACLSEPSGDTWTCDPDELMACATADPANFNSEVCAAATSPHLVDCASSSHIDNSKVNVLEDFKPGMEMICLGKKSLKVPALGRGKLGNRENVLRAPEMSYRLTSTPQLDVAGMWSVFGDRKCLMFDKTAASELRDLCARLADRVTMRANLRAGLYHVDEEFEGLEPATIAATADSADAHDESTGSESKMTVPDSTDTVELKKVEKPFAFARDRRLVKGHFGTIREGTAGDLNDLERLHLRLGHMSAKMLLDGLKNNAFHGAQTTFEKCKDQKLRPCEACMLGGMKAQSVPRSLTEEHPMAPMEEIGLDPVPLSTMTVDGNSVVNIGYDYATGYHFSYETKSEGDQKTVVDRIIQDYCTPFGHQIKKIHTDAATVFKAKDFQNFLTKKSIKYESSPPYQHQKNRVESCGIKPIEHTARVLLADSGLPARFAGYAIRAAEDAHNSIPHGTSLISPYEALTGMKPDISGLRQFGQVAYYYLSEKERATSDDPRWKEALDKERNVMLDPTRPKYEDYYDRPKRFMRAVLSFRIKTTDTGEAQYKARICPDGSTQLKGIDYAESYSPTAGKELILLALHIAAANDWPLKQFDIGAAYLEVPAQHNQYMRLTPDMVRHGFAKTEFVRLLANFYGNPDAGRHWYVYMAALLLEFGMEQSAESPCLFTTTTGEGEDRLMLFVVLVVDDGLYGGNWVAMMAELEAFLTMKLQKVKINPLTKFCGILVERDREKRVLTVSTGDYDNQVVQKYTTASSTARADTPMINNLEYRGLQGNEPPIRGVVGSLNYAAGITWPELKVPVSLLGSAGDAPHQNHTKGAVRAVRYMNEHKTGRVLHLGGNEKVKLIAYADASYTPDQDATFLYGYALMLSRTAGAIEVVSHRSKTISHSSLQSEVKALDETCRAVEAMRRLLEEFGMTQQAPTEVFTDSQGAIDLIANHFGFHPKCRHFNRDVHYVRQCVQLGIIVLRKVHTDSNPADLLTKLESADKTMKFTDMLLRGVKYEIGKDNDKKVHTC